MSTTSKWDTELAFSMYCGGMTIQQIIETPEFSHLPHATVKNIAHTGKWADRRARLARLPHANAVDNAAKALQERLVEEGLEHQSFILGELKRERICFSRRPRTGDDQAERLKALQMIDDIARKTCKLDEEKKQNPITQGFAFIVHLQSTPNSQLRKADEVLENMPSAILSLPDDKKAPMGILRSNNAIVEGEETTENLISGPPGQPKPMPDAKSLFSPVQPLVN